MMFDMKDVNLDMQIVTKYGVFIGEKDDTGNPTIHLQRVFAREHDVTDHLKYLPCKVKFVIPITCDKNLE